MLAEKKKHTFAMYEIRKTMPTPFLYGKLVEVANFTNRTAETKQLQDNFRSGINTILLSPRRWGKSSLVKKAASEYSKKNDNTKIVYLDLFNTRNEADFYKELSEQTINTTSGKMEEWIANAKEYLKNLNPKISISPNADQPLSLDLNWNNIAKEPNDILNLAENIAQEKGIKIVICIDEFQNLSYYNSPLDFQKKLRSHWQHHQNVSYCLYGSKRHMMLDIFASTEMPFYKFGDIIFLDKISNEHWKDYITKQFRTSGKTITRMQAGRIAELVENHSYYVQQLAQQCWLRANDSLEDEIIDEALESLILQLSLLFQNITEGLSTKQLNFLHAVQDKVEMYSAQTTLEKYKLGTSANIGRIKAALINKEIIDERIPGKVDILDPIYNLWLKNYYFTK